MASQLTSAPPFHSIGISHRPSAGTFAPFILCVAPAGHNLNGAINLRLKKVLQVQVKNRWSSASASNIDNSEKSDETESSADASGPPFLTILAGLVVFLFISWIIGSIVMWVFGFILHPPQ